VLCEEGSYDVSGESAMRWELQGTQELVGDLGGLESLSDQVVLEESVVLAVDLYCP
jgi:hypothetical protein